MKTSKGPEMIHLRAALPPVTCEIHDWSTEGLGRRLVDTMRERHGKGGVNVCRECVTRARGDAKAEVAQRMSIVPLEEVRAGDFALFEDPAKRVMYGAGHSYKVEKVGPKNLDVSGDVRFAPDGPWHHQEHKLPRAHLKEVFRLEPIEYVGEAKAEP